MTVLSAKNISKRFGGLAALSDVSVDLVPHKINLLIGANGCGKTTLINVISGLIEHDFGKVELLGKDISSESLESRYNLGMVRTFQTPRLFSNLSVLENLLVSHHSPGEIFRHSFFKHKWKKHESDLRKKALEVLEEINLSHLEHNLAYDLSGGQIKLLELGKILMSDSELVLLDEPIAGINPKLAHTIFEKIVDICKKHKTTFLIIEHRLDIALRYSDYVFVMDQGEIIARGMPDKILQNKAVIDSYLR